MEKIKVAIDLLSSALTENANSIPAGSSSSSSRSSNSFSSSSSIRAASTSAGTTASTSAQASASTTSSTSSFCVTKITRSQAISACGQALDALIHLKQMRLAEQRANFQSHHSDTKHRKCGSAGETSGTPNKMAKKLKYKM